MRKRLIYEHLVRVYGGAHVQHEPARGFRVEVLSPDETLYWAFTFTYAQAEQLMAAPVSNSDLYAGKWPAMDEEPVVV